MGRRVGDTSVAGMPESTYRGALQNREDCGQQSAPSAINWLRGSGGGVDGGRTRQRCKERASDRTTLAAALCFFAVPHVAGTIIRQCGLVYRCENRGLFVKIYRKRGSVTCLHDKGDNKHEHDDERASQQVRQVLEP